VSPGGERPLTALNEPMPGGKARPSLDGGRTDGIRSDCMNANLGAGASTAWGQKEWVYCGRCGRGRALKGAIYSAIGKPGQFR